MRAQRATQRMAIIAHLCVDAVIWSDWNGPSSHARKRLGQALCGTILTVVEGIPPLVAATAPAAAAAVAHIAGDDVLFESGRLGGISKPSVLLATSPAAVATLREDGVEQALPAVYIPMVGAAGSRCRRRRSRYRRRRRPA